MCRNIKTLHNFKPPATEEEKGGIRYEDNPGRLICAKKDNQAQPRLAWALRRIELCNGVRQYRSAIAMIVPHFRLGVSPRDTSNS